MLIAMIWCSQAADLKKRRAFRKFQYRGVELDQLLDLSNEQLIELVHARARRRFQRGLKRKPMGLIKKLRKAKKEAPPNEKPAVVKTHLRDMLVVPEMIGSVIGVRCDLLASQTMVLTLDATDLQRKVSLGSGLVDIRTFRG